jgi:glycosyltransferase involved in cell wall biosynthesis
LRVWLIKIGEPIALLDSSVRAGRMSLLAESLRQRGHEVVWWASTFSHGSRSFLADREVRLHSASGVAVHLLPSRGYTGHVSVARFWEHFRTARLFARRAIGDAVPDVVLCALPTLELCAAATRYGAAAGVPVVIDVRDWWPDVFALAAPQLLRPAVRVATTPLRRTAVRALRSAAAVTGITEEFVDWGLAKAGRPRGQWDRAFPFGYPTDSLTGVARDEALAWWSSRDVAFGPGQPLTVVFAGTLGHAHDLGCILEAAERLHQQRVPVRFVLCGDGERIEQYRERARHLGNVLFPGWVRRDQLHALLERADAALSLAPNRPDYLASINNKPIEYLSFGLPLIVSPPASTVARLTTDSGCGFVIAGDDSVELAATVERLVASPEVRSGMSRRARVLFEGTFRADVIYGDMAEHLERIAFALGPAATRPSLDPTPPVVRAAEFELPRVR